MDIFLISSYVTHRSVRSFKALLLFFFVRVSVELFLFMANLALSLKRDFSRTSEEYPGSKGGLFTLTGTWKTLRLVCVCVCVCVYIHIHIYVYIHIYKLFILQFPAVFCPALWEFHSSTAQLIVLRSS